MHKTKADALLAGAKRYYPEIECRSGHVAPRRAATGECLACRQEAVKVWRSKNPERVAAHNQKQYDTHTESLKQRAKSFYWQNGEACREKSKQYQQANLHIFAKANAKRKAAEIQRTPAWLTADDHWMMEQAYELAALRTKMFGFPWHVDHVVPLQGDIVSGLHVPLNLQVLPARDNRAKSNKFEVM